MKSKTKYKHLKWILPIGALAAIFISLIPNMVLLKMQYEQDQIAHAKIKPTVIQNGISIEPLTRKAHLFPLTNEGEAGALAYKWQDFYFRYDLKCTSEIRGLNLDTIGYVNYQSNSTQDFAIIKEFDEIEKTRSGTGFVVHPEGIIVTSAQIVFGANRIDVELDGIEYQADIIGYNPNSDLAVLKIQAEGLTFIPIAEANQIELAEEIRVLRHSLSNALEEELEITAGTVTEFVEEEEARLLQIDAAINPEDRGGPVLDNQGRVLGVASTFHRGEEIPNTGFAIAAETVSQMLSDLVIPIAQSNSETPLNEMEFNKRTKPAIARIKVQAATGGFRFVPNIVNYHSSMDTTGSKREKNRESSRMVVDAYGKIQLHKGQEGLPYRLGSIGKIGLERLSQTGEKEWKTEEETLIAESEVTSKWFLVNPGLVISGSQKKLTPPDKLKIYHPAVIRTSYKIVSKTNNSTKVEKKYSLITLDKKTGNKPYLEITGKGTFEFNKEEGYPTTGTMNYKITQYHKPSNRHITLPVTLNYAYLEFGEELKFMTAMNNGTAREYVKNVGR
ncbi:MAG: hypothetical protein COA78_08380 [Blastopirellula sp.]|nr:MAG: hypothetical protein COA78_08380 [Blastopirellula sp.]